jgi:hypothetical protein
VVAQLMASLVVLSSTEAVSGQGWIAVLPVGTSEQSA